MSDSSLHFSLNTNNVRHAVLFAHLTLSLVNLITLFYTNLLFTIYFVIISVSIIRFVPIHIIETSAGYPFVEI